MVAKDITVMGTVVTVYQLEGAFASLKNAFEFADVKQALVKIGVGFHIADRAADRLLQIKRRRGDCKYHRGYWWKVSP